MAVSAPKVVIVMADYGHEPTETTIPYTHFKNAGFEVSFATERGKAPECDKRLCEGVIQKLLGARKSTLELYHQMKASPECTSPLSWTSPTFSLLPFDLVFLPGGHEKSVRQVLDSPELAAHVSAYFPLTARHPPSSPTSADLPAGAGKKGVVAICHGVQVLAHARGKNRQSVIRGCETTSLPARFEQAAFWGTRAFLGDYYKTYGKGTVDVEKAVRRALKDPKAQFKTSLGMRPFIVSDPCHNYISARFPNDVDIMSEAAIKMVRGFYEPEHAPEPAAASPEEGMNTPDAVMI